MAHSASFWNRIATKYSKSPIADEAAYEKKLEISREYFTPESELLEIGCGTGSTAVLHAPFVKHIDAVDISENMISIACSKAESEGVDNIDFRVLDSDDLQVASESKDAVLALSLLHLVEDKEALMEKAHAALKPGGVFITSTACIADFMAWMKYILPVGRALRLLPFVKVFSADELRASMKAAGFEILYDWQPAKNKGLFIVAKKSDS